MRGFEHEWSIIVDRLRVVVLNWTGHEVVLTPNWRQVCWIQKPRILIVPTSTASNDQAEYLLHEICHYAVATPRERKQPNLMLDWARQTVRREIETSLLELWILAQSDFRVREFFTSNVKPRESLNSYDWNKDPVLERQIVAKILRGDAQPVLQRVIRILRETRRVMGLETMWRRGKRLRRAVEFKHDHSRTD